MIEIPGYCILRTLGRGGMATVYLAVQESVQREVALKVMASPLLADPEFGQRFLREARIAANLRHPNVVQVHDVAAHKELPYIAMEYLSGGPVLRKGEPPRRPEFALKVTQSIASALGYAHEKGVIHRDIKPDNILLREDGSAVLTDFGIARAEDATRMTRTGAIVGTPHYMSPEQARGHPVDGRADLYSLGIVLYQLLTGEVPYRADDPVAIGILHLSAPVPRLPAEFSRLQSLLDRMLAKEPANRFQSGESVALAIAALDIDWPAVYSEARASPQQPKTDVPPLSGESLVMEPSLGRLEEVTAVSERRRQLRPRRKQYIGILLLLLLIASSGALWQYQDGLRAMLPDTQFNALMEQADRALASGRYQSDEQGNGARELYSAAAALDPDHPAPREGLRHTGEALLARAETALAAGRLAEAERDIAASRELGLPAEAIARVETVLRQRASAGVALDDLLERARTALRTNRIDDGNGGAIALYRQALTLAPDNAVARAGLDDALGALLQTASASLAAGDRSKAEELIARVAEIDPAHLGLPAARAALAEQARSDVETLEERLRAAELLLSKGQLIAPPGDNARDAFRTIIAAYPGEARAKEGLHQVTAALVRQAERALADFDFAKAETLLTAAEALPPKLPAIQAIRQKMATLQAEAARLQSNAAVAARDSARIPELLQAARDAAAAGNLMTPPGECAYDHYREVLAIDAENAEAKAGLAALPGEARKQAESALAANDFKQANSYIDDLGQLAPDDPAFPGLRQRLAKAWLGYASERLGAGEIERASQAFDQARKADPNNPELTAFAARLEQARGG